VMGLVDPLWRPPVFSRPKMNAANNATLNLPFINNLDKLVISQPLTGPSPPYAVASLGLVVLPTYTVATLPALSASLVLKGARANVSDAHTPTFMAAVVGGGSRRFIAMEQNGASGEISPACLKSQASRAPCHRFQPPLDTVPRVFIGWSFHLR
jgi:hypothetical protein